MAYLMLLCQAVIAVTFTMSTAAKVGRSNYREFRRSLLATAAFGAALAALAPSPPVATVVGESMSNVPGSIAVLYVLGLANLAVTTAVLLKFRQQSELLRQSIEGVTNPEPIMSTAGDAIGDFVVTTTDGAVLTQEDLEPATRHAVAGSIRAAAALALSCAARLLAVRVLLALAVGAAPVAVAWLMKVVLDRLVQPDQPLFAALLLLAGAAAAAALLPEVARYVDAELQRAVGLTTQQRLYAAVCRLAGLRRFEDPRFHDRLAVAAETGSTGPSEVVSSAFGVAQGVLTLSAFLATLALINPWMLAVAIVAAAPALRAELRLGRQRARMVWELGHAARREFFYAQLMTSVTAAKEVRLYGLGGLFGARMLAEMRQIRAGQRRMDRRERGLPSTAPGVPACSSPID